MLPELSPQLRPKQPRQTSSLMILKERNPERLFPYFVDCLSTTEASATDWFQCTRGLNRLVGGDDEVLGINCEDNKLESHLKTTLWCGC